MRNSVMFKFIALLLCAASLLGVVASGAGLMVMTETGLYNKTAGTLYRENLEIYSQMRARALARHYADKILGGCTEEMLAQEYSLESSAPFVHDRFGYVLLDAEGNELERKELVTDEKVTTLTFPVTGQYMHLVELVSQSRRKAEEVQYADTDAQGSVKLDRISSEGCAISEMEVTTASGEYYYGAAEAKLGVAFHNENRQVVYLGNLELDRELRSDEVLVTRLFLWDSNGEMVYMADSAEGIGTLRRAQDGQNVIFLSYAIPEPVPEETYVEEPVVTATEEARSPTIPATEAAAAEETAPEGKEESGEKPDSEKKEKNEETSDSEKKEKTEEKPDSEKKEKSEETSDSEKKEKTEETSDSEKKEKTEEKPDSEKKEKTEETSDSEKKEKNEETSDSEKQEKTEEKSDSEKKENAEEKSDPEKKETSEEKPDSEKPEKAGEDAEQSETVPETTAVTVPPMEPTLPPETIPEETVPPETEPVLINGKRLDEYQINRTTYLDERLGEEVTAKYIYLPMPEMTVEFYVAPNALNDSALYTVLAYVRALRDYLLPVLGISLLAFAMTVVYLCCAAGRKPKSDEVRAGGLNRIPIDLYLCLAGGGVVCAAFLVMQVGMYFLQREVLTGCAFAGGMAFLGCLLAVGFLFAFVAQIKTPGGFWWRNSLVGWSLRLLKWLWKQFLGLCAWLEEKLSSAILPALGRLLRWCWTVTVRVWKWVWHQVYRFFLLLSWGFNRFCDLLPVTWQWLLTGGTMLLLLVAGVLSRSEGWMVLFVCLCFALVCYGAHCFGALMEATKKMNKGDLDSKVDDKLMVGAFKDFAKDLNDLGGVAVVAAQKQLKSERMKTELITNVSHDIRTPLTSIINYVDLLQKAHTEEEREQYLEVLDRQSLRLKNLIDDLIDMSKASTGNMAVDITLVDAVESVNQALGEFGDKLERAQLYPVFRHTEESVAMMADGRLVWRVLSNLLNNAVKYAMPGTRLYIDLMSLDSKVVISLKNISRDELNVDAEELMERFVRGDDARNTEGSGLGLNIAKSLMELQKGQLQLLVDGDLFKVTLIFPGA